MSGQEACDSRVVGRRIVQIAQMAGGGDLHALRLRSLRGECIPRGLAAVEIELAAEHEDGHLDLRRRSGSSSRGILGLKIVACVAGNHARKQLMRAWISSSEPYERVCRPLAAERFHAAASSELAVKFVGDIRGAGASDGRRPIENET